MAIKRDPSFKKAIIKHNTMEKKEGWKKSSWNKSHWRFFK
jgi:hypothetical protein